MGSGGLVVLDDTDCMVDIARYFLRFTQDQSCGKCTFCRIGTRRMLDILDRICTGDGQAGRPGRAGAAGPRRSSAGSICGLGKTAPNPVLSTLRYFRDEYEAHLAGRCPAGKCKALITYRDHRRLHRLHALRPALPGRRDPDDALRAAPHRPGEMHPLRHLPAGLPEQAVWWSEGEVEMRPTEDEGCVNSRHGMNRYRCNRLQSTPCPVSRTTIMPTVSRVLIRTDYMPTITIDHREVEVPAGATVLDAARTGHRHPHALLPRGLRAVDVRAWCAWSSCRTTGRLVPSCATLVADGMEVESETRRRSTGCGARRWNCC